MLIFFFSDVWLIEMIWTQVKLEDGPIFIPKLSWMHFHHVNYGEDGGLLMEYW
jgi:hypothetical protein